MKKTIFIITLLISTTTWAQLQQLTLQKTRGLYPQALNAAQWRNDKEVTYLTQRYDTLMLVNVKNATSSALVSLTQINSLLKAENIDELVYIEHYEWINDNTLRVINGSQIFTYDIAQKKITEKLRLNDNAENVELSPDRKKAAYTIANNLYVEGIAMPQFAVTNDADTGWVSGQTVSRVEFGIEKGIFWSPNSNYVAFYRKDESRVAEYPIVNIETRIAQAEPIRYPMAGEASEELWLGVHNVSTKKTIYIQPTDFKSDRYLTAISWSPDEKYVYIGVLNREQNHLKLNQYDATTGAYVKTLFEEKSNAYVEPEKPMLFLPTQPNQFIWQSERDGFNHLYLYNTDGSLVRQITKGNWEVTQTLGFDKKDEFLYYISTAQSPIERQVYKVNIKNATITQITKTKGTHDAVLSPEKTQIIDSWSSLETPNVSDIIDVNGKLVNNIFKASNPSKVFDVAQTEIFTIKSADGNTDLYARMLKPSNFDATKKYPVMIYVYGGPHAQMITDSWLGGASPWMHVMAQKGYIVFTLDNRGSAHRGFAFESAIHRQMGQLEMADQMKGVEYLKKQAYIDADRIGVHGWSYGGFMTISLMLNYPETFKVGVAGGPVIDWKYYEVMYGERYMDMPAENPDGYAKTSLIAKADQLKGRLLIIHGDIDPTVVWQHSLVFVRECVSKGKQLDYFVYPRHEHNVAGKDRLHLIQKIMTYFDDFLF